MSWYNYSCNLVDPLITKRCDWSEIRSHGSVGSPYWPMYITTSSLPGSASGSTNFRGLPHLPKGRIGRPLGIERCRPVLPLPQHFRECRYSWSHGSVGRAHRSHRWGHRFESCCDHHNLSENYSFQTFLLPIFNINCPKVKKQGPFSPCFHAFFCWSMRQVR